MQIRLSKVDKTDYLPAYVQIKRNLLRMMQKGAFPKGTALPAEADIAKMCGVSKMTARNAITELVRAGRLIRVNGKGTFLAQAVRQSKTIAIIGAISKSSFLTNPYYFRLISSMEAELSAKGYSIFLSHDPSEQYSMILNDLSHIHCICIIGYTRNNEKELLKLKRNNVPFLLIGRYFDDYDAVSVSADHEQSGYKAAEYLIRQGCQRIGFVTFDVTRLTFGYRLAGYRQALKHHNQELNANMIFTVEPPGTPNQDLIRKYLCHSARPDGLVLSLSATFQAAEFLKIVQACGLKIGADVKFVGFDNIDDELDRFNAPFAFIWQPMEDIGRKAARLAIDLGEGRAEESKKHLFPVQLIERNS